MKRRTVTFKVRLTPEEAALLKKKASNYQSISHTLRMAIERFDETELDQREERLTLMLEYYKKWYNELSWMGSNLNQTVKRANELSIAQNITVPFFETVLFPVINDLEKLISDLKRSFDKDVIRQTSHNAK